MSIRQFSNRPCAMCQKDTTHFAGKCMDCGTVDEYRSFRQFQQKRVAHYAASGMNKYGAVAMTHTHERVDAAARRAEYEATPTYKLYRSRRK